MFANLPKILKRFVVISSAVFVSLYILIWILSPWVVNHYLTAYFEPQGLVLSDNTSIRLNPFRSRLEVNTLELIRSDSEKVLALPYMSIELHLHKLIFEEIYISEVTVKGLDLTIEKVKENLLIAGISLATPAADKKEPTAEEVSTDPLPYRVVMPEFVLVNSKIDFHDGKELHRLKLESININHVSATTKEQSFQFSIKSDLDKGPIEVNVIADIKDAKGKVEFDLNIVDIDVEKFTHLLPQDIDSLVGLVSYHGEQNIRLKDDAVIFNVDKGVFSSAGLNAGQKDAHVFVGKQSLALADFSFYLNTNKESVQYNKSSINATASIKIENVNVYNKDKTKTLAAVAEVSLDNIKLFENKQGVQKVTIGKLDFVDSFFSDNKDNPIPALMKFSSLNIKNIDLSQYGIEVEAINLTGLIANAELDQDKKVKNLLELPIAKEKGVIADSQPQLNEVDNSEPQINEVSPAFNIKLEQFNLTDSAEIFFLDQSVKPAYQRRIVVSTLSAGPFDTQNKNQESVITIGGKSNRYASFDFVTKAKPFLAKPSYDIKGDFKELSLPGLSSYVKEALQYEIESGQLDLGVDVQLVGTELDGDVQLLLRGIELTAADDYETSSLNDQTSVPFNVALGMLKDSDGNVELSLPITGDTSSPNFGASGFLTLLVKQATIMGAKDYLVTTFVPYASVVNIAVLAGEYALKVRINDLPYSSKSIELQPEQKQFLDQFSALLRDRDETQVKLCAIATAKDIDKAAGSELTSDEDIKRLKEISLERVDIFKDYMIKKEKIKSSRLLLCTPQIDSDIDAVSRISFET